MRFLESYNGFLLLNESKVVFSDKFTDILRSMESEIAQSLLSIANTDKNVAFNYIDISNTGKLSFIDDKKAEKFPMWEGPRQETTIGKLVRKILPGVKDTDLEKFSNELKAKILEKSGELDRFKIFRGDDIINFYQEIEYDHDEGIGQLGKSCMNGQPEEFFDIYKLNPDKVGLVILFDEDENMIGRALLWNTENGFTFMDRIYTYEDSDIELFKLFANKMGFWYKELQNTSYRNRDNFIYRFNIVNNNKVKNEDIIVKLDNHDVEFYPYLDSLCYFNTETGELSNNRFAVNADILICNTDGEYKDSDFEWKFD